MIKDLEVGKEVELSKLSKNEHKTVPPARYSEVSLVKALSDLGIGRPSTFASIVSVIQDRGYVRKVSGQQLAPTFLGFAVIQLLTNHFPQYTAFEYTSKMEEELEKIDAGTQTRPKFLASFWNGKGGFEAFVKNLSTNIDWDEVKKLTTTELGNGYSVTYNRHGAFLQDDNGKPNEKGYLPSAKVDDDALAEDFLDPDVCKEYIANAKKGPETHELGVLKDGEYKGWTVTARSGRYGDYLQAVKPDADKKVKPINQKLPEGLALGTVTLDDVKDLFAEVKLPRWSPDGKFLVGVGKRGPYMGFKATPKSRKVIFKSLPEGFEPRTVSFDEVKKAWEEANAK